MLPALTGFIWNADAHRYIDSDTGRFVSSSAVRDALENVMDDAALTMNGLSQQLLDGTISLSDWQTGMMSEIKTIHVASTASASGGWAQVTQSQWGAAGQLIREQYDYLRNFASQIASGEQPLDGRVLVRSDMYSDAGRATYEDIRQRGMINLGYEEERYILEDTENACDGCIDRANEGWQPIGTLEPLGSQECMVRDRCTVEYRRLNEFGEWEEN